MSNYQQRPDAMKARHRACDIAETFSEEFGPDELAEAIHQFKNTISNIIAMRLEKTCAMKESLEQASKSLQQ
jgi:plasmid maintenance system antidote protein VapI